MKRRLSIFFALLLLLQTAASCGDSQPNDTPVTDGGTTEAETTSADVFAGLADKTYNGREFNFLIRETEYDDYYIEKETGDVLDDAVYRRNTEVEQRFDVKINPISINGAWSNRDNYLGAIRNSVMAGSGEYDLVDGYAGIIGGLFTDNICMNLWDVPNLRFNEKWWSALVADELTVNGKLYDMTGDLAINMWSNLHAMYFNKSMIEDYGRTSPYDRVNNGTWTYDAFLSDIKDVSKDLDGDGNKTEKDQWGFLVYDSIALDNLHNAFDIPVSKTGADGFPTFDLQNEKLIGAVEKITALAFENPDSLYMKQGNPNIIADSRGIFTSGNAMYFTDTLAACTAMRDSNTDFGIIPLPKYDEKQEGYYTSSRDGRTMFVIPNDVKDVDYVGLITEALAVASHKYVIPAYYDVTLKTKAARDDESAAMLDIIRDGLKLEFVAEYQAQTGGGGFSIRICMQNNNTEYVSMVASNLNTYKASLENFLEAYK